MSNHISIMIKAGGTDAAMKIKDALRAAGYTIYLGDPSAEIEALRAEVASKSEQIGNLYRVCNEKTVLRLALKPFAEIADLVNHTDVRDGETVYRLPNPAGGYFTLVREDFRRAARAFEQKVAPDADER